MKLAMLTQDFPPDIGGIQTYSFELAKRLASFCDDFVVIAPGNAQDAKEDKTLEFDVLRINCKSTLLGFKSVRKGLVLLKKRGITNVFHTQWQTMYFSKVGKSREVVKNVFCAVHGRELFFNPFGSYPILGTWYKNHMISSLNKVDLFLPVSRFTADKLKEINQRNAQIEVVGNGTDPSIFYPKNVGELKHSLGVSDRRILMTVSRLVKRKGIDTCIEAVDKIKDRIPEIVYLIVGDGPDVNRLKQMVSNRNLQNYVRFVGRVDSTVDYYNLADVFLMPSRSILPDVEGFGITFLEANACGVPVIGSNSGGIPDAIEHGKTGYLIKEDDVDTLVEYIGDLINSPSMASKMGMDGRKRVEDAFNWDVAAKKIYTLMKNL